RYYEELEWHLLKYPVHDAFRRYLSDLNVLYKKTVPLWDEDHSWSGFRWVVSKDNENGIIAFERISRSGEKVLVVVNFMPGSHDKYPLGFDSAVTLNEVFNSEGAIYSGCQMVNEGSIKTVEQNYGDRLYSLHIKIPPLSALYFKVE
ncbi:MAG: alpha amylase C-terminal domain-containing protein, partial [Clostridia bacterium]|nr:alpha amylase C-terminal domain-containing protein [Clostridia bacterium]